MSPVLLFKDSLMFSFIEESRENIKFLAAEIWGNMPTSFLPKLSVKQNKKCRVKKTQSKIA